MERIEAEVLIPGDGEPVRDGVVVLEGTVITYAGPAGGAPETPGANLTRAAAVLPGLWDCHTHLMGTRKLDMNLIVLEPVALRAARAVSDLRAALDSGFTSVREVGGVGAEVARAVEDGSVQGPSVYAAGSVLSTTGGHGDLHAFPMPWAADLLYHSGGDLRLCDGLEGCARAVREQLRRNAKVIKVCASGGVLSEFDNPVHQQFTNDELRVIVEVAGLAERLVAAHCHGKPGIMAALAAGCRTIEHGTYLDEEACDAMRETGAVLVPTRTIIEDALTRLEIPDYALRKMRVVAERHAEALALAHERGVTIALGTDLGVTGPVDVPNTWGRNGHELGYLVAAGMTPLEAIKAATANGPLTLGPQAPHAGVLAEGYDADVITLDADPLTDVKVLAGPDHVTGVWKSGHRVKDATAA